MASTIQQKIDELEARKGELDSQITALKAAQKIMGGSAAPTRSLAKKVDKAVGIKEKNRSTSTRGAKGGKRTRRSEQQKKKDLQKIVDSLPKSADKGVNIRALAKNAGRKVDITLRNDVKELLDNKQIQKSGERVKTVYYK